MVLLIEYTRSIFLWAFKALHLACKDTQPERCFCEQRPCKLTLRHSLRVFIVLLGLKLFMCLESRNIMDILTRERVILEVKLYMKKNESETDANLSIQLILILRFVIRFQGQYPKRCTLRFVVLIFWLVLLIIYNGNKHLPWVSMKQGLITKVIQLHVFVLAFSIFILHHPSKSL